MRTLVWIVALSGSLLGQTLKPEDVQVLGAIDYGQVVDAAEYAGNPQFSAYIFNGQSGDKVEVIATGNGRKADVAIADGTLKQLATGTGRVSFTLPDKGADPEAYYLLFRDSQGAPATFKLEIRKAEGARAGLR